MTCLACHNVSGDKDIETVISKFSHHPVESAMGVHDPREDPLSAMYHVECADCHNPHQLNNETADPPMVNGRNGGVKGVTIDGFVTALDAQYEYEICFRCHADNSFVDTNTIPRQVEEINKRLAFNPVNPSFHPVAALGKGLDVPSLRPEYTTSSMIYCTDCHNNNDSVKAGGTGTNGPHGSDYSPLLIGRYEMNYPQDYSVSSYEVCFRCHDPLILMDPLQSPFPSHNSHVHGHKIPCSVCHDAHGVSLVSGGTVTANAHLINFDITVVTSGSYDSIARSCTVSCHHANPKSY